MPSRPRLLQTELGRQGRVVQQRGDGHRADPAGHGGDQRCDLHDFGKVHVTHYMIAGPAAAVLAALRRALAAATAVAVMLLGVIVLQRPMPGVSPSRVSSIRPLRRPKNAAMTSFKPLRAMSIRVQGQQKHFLANETDQTG